MIVICKNRPCIDRETFEPAMRYDHDWHYWNDYEEPSGEYVMGWLGPEMLMGYVVSYWLVPGTVTDDFNDDISFVRGPAFWGERE